MMRITVHENSAVVTFQIEGRLAASLVRELEACWRDTVARSLAPVRRVDLTGVTSIDTVGRACLGAMYRDGAEFIATDCLTKSVVAEITQGR